MQRFLLPFLLLSVLCTAGCGEWPPLTIRVDGDDAQVDVRNLGEYGTQVSRIRLRRHGSSEVIWEAISANSPQIPGFSLTVGGNPPLPKHLEDFGFQAVTPTGAGGFQLARGTVYTLEVWSGSQNSVASEDFVFPALPRHPPSDR